MSEENEKKLKKNNKATLRASTKIINLLVLVAVLIGLGWVVRSYYNIGNNNYTNAAQVEAFINPINTRVSAYITDIRFIEHQKVAKGDTLLILDDREIQTQVQQAEAAYTAALASKKVVENSVKTVSNNINTADANLAASKARLLNVEQNYNRYATLVKEGAVTMQQFDQIKAEFDAQKAQYQALVTSRNTTSLSITETQSRIEMNDADIMRAKSALDMAKLNLSYTAILAPHDGIMGRRSVNIGQLLSPGQQVATIVDNKNQWITANYREKQMEYVQIGELATIKVDALGGKVFEGKVTAISGATGARYAAIPVDNSTGNFVKVQQRIPIRIELTQNNDSKEVNMMRAGMNVEVTLK